MDRLAKINRKSKFVNRIRYLKIRRKIEFSQHVVSDEDQGYRYVLGMELIKEQIRADVKAI
jgi:hypothetical protein